MYPDYRGATETRNLCYTNQKYLNDLIRDLGFMMSIAELLTSRLKQFNFIDESG